MQRAYIPPNVYQYRHKAVVVTVRYSRGRGWYIEPMAKYYRSPALAMRAWARRHS